MNTSGPESFDVDGNPDADGVYLSSGAAMSVAHINARSRRKAFTDTPAAVPDIPAERYDVCECGHPRFMHPRYKPVTRPWTKGDEFGGECWLSYAEVRPPR